MRKAIKIFTGFLIFLVIACVGGYFYLTYQVEGKYFESDGVKIHYTDEGSGIPVLLVHGFAANADLNWRRPGIHKRLIKEGFRVINMDLRGHGKSAKPHETSMYGVHVAEDVVNLMNHLQLEKAHLVGYSLGGFVALKSAALAPERWTTVTLMASGWDDPATSRSFEALERAINDFEAGKPVGPLIDYFAETGETKTGFIHRQWFKILTTYINDRKAMAAMIKGGRELAVPAGELAALKIPMCGIIGDKDPLITKAQALSENVQNHTFIIIEGANHITTANSKKAKDGLVEFLKGNASR